MKVREIRAEIVRFLESANRGFSRVLNEQVWHLSGGEHQLLSLAVAAVLVGSRKGKHLLLLDEHVSQLDTLARKVVMEATERLIRESAISAIMATHDPRLACRYGDRQIVISHGRVVCDLNESRLSNQKRP